MVWKLSDWKKGFTKHFKKFQKVIFFPKSCKNSTKLCWKCFPHSLLKAWDDIDADIKRACSILLSKSEFSFALLLVTFEPFDLEQSYIPHLKALMCGINAAEAQRCDCMFTFCYAYPKMGVLLHKMANASHSSSGTVPYKYFAKTITVWRELH